MSPSELERDRDFYKRHYQRVSDIKLAVFFLVASVILSFFWLTTFAYAETVNAVRPVVIIDGDTIDIDGVRIRILEIDTPETFRSRCDQELVAGLAAKARLRQLLDSGPVRYDPRGRDRYGRTLAYVFAGYVNVGAKLLDEGFALPYQPGRIAKARRLGFWCRG